MNKKKNILIVIIFALAMVGITVGVILISNSHIGDEKEPNVVHHEYGTSAGNMGYGCQGADNFYFLRWDAFDGRGHDMYVVLSNNEVKLLDNSVHYLNYYKGYVYYKKRDNGFDYIYKLDDSTGEKEMIFEPCKYLDEDYKFADIWNMKLVDGKILFDIEYGHSKNEKFYAKVRYNCDSGIAEETNESTSYTSVNHSDLKDELDTGDYKRDLSWIYKQGDYRDPNQQYYGEYLYGIAKTTETEESEDWSECYYAPRDFCMVKTWDVMDGDVGDALIKLDTQVTQFNVGYKYIYYAKVESGKTFIWRNNLTGGEQVKVTTIENDSWVIDILAGDNVLICTFSDWESNRDLHASEKVYEVYFIDIDSGEVTLLDDKIVTDKN